MHKTMNELPYRSALIVGAGPGISAAVARRLATSGVRVGLAARRPDKLSALAREIDACTFEADASHADAVARLFAEADDKLGAPEIVLFNASARAQGPLADLDPHTVEAAVQITALGGFFVVQQAARRMLRKGHGAILLTGATASIKGYAKSAAFAMGKFALRGLAQSAARELGPQGIHVAHFIIDGVVRSAARPDPATPPDSTLDPDAIAATYLDVLRQPRSAWSLEVELRPWIETF
jgi:NAD(P)-dependent dehydrogenase (short-subunit alcohol dehydrogenase family)